MTRSGAPPSGRRSGQAGAAAMGRATVRSDRQHIAGGQCPSTERPHRAHEAGGPAAQHRRHVDAATDRQRRPRARDAPPELSAARPAGLRTADSRGAGRPSTDSSKAAPQTAQSTSPSDVELGSDQRNLQRGRVTVVPDQPVRQPMRVRVHRPRHGHAVRLMAPSSEILHGRQHPAAHDRHASSRRALFEFGAGDRVKADLIADLEAGTGFGRAGSYGFRAVRPMMFQPPGVTAG